MVMNRLGEMIRSRGISRPELAEAADTTLPTIHKLERGERKLTVEWANRLAPPLQCEPWELLFDIYKKIDRPISGYVGAGNEIFPIDNLADSEHAQMVKVPADLGLVTIVKIRGDSMWPKYADGQLVAYGPHAKFSDQVLGKECVVRTNEGQMFLKIVQAGTKTGLATLVSHNASPIENVKLDWAAPLVNWIDRDGVR